MSTFQKEWYHRVKEEKREQWRTSSKLSRIRAKCRVLEHYGGECNCCGEERIEFLTIDHIEGGGNSHRKEIFGNQNQSGSRFYRWIIKQGYPNDYQVLCWNCNTAKHYYNMCPHKRLMKVGE